MADNNEVFNPNRELRVQGTLFAIRTTADTQQQVTPLGEGRFRIDRIVSAQTVTGVLANLFAEGKARYAGVTATPGVGAQIVSPEPLQKRADLMLLLGRITYHEEGPEPPAERRARASAFVLSTGAKGIGESCQAWITDALVAQAATEEEGVMVPMEARVSMLLGSAHARRSQPDENNIITQQAVTALFASAYAYTSLGEARITLGALGAQVGNPPG